MVINNTVVIIIIVIVIVIVNIIINRITARANVIVKCERSSRQRESRSSAMNGNSEVFSVWILCNDSDDVDDFANRDDDDDDNDR